MVVLRHLHDACNSIDHMERGGHYFCTYADLHDFREAYCKYCKKALEHNRIVILLPYYETTKQVEFFLENVGIDIAMNRRAHSLFILDSVKQFSGTDQDFYKFLAILDKGSVQSGKSGVSVIIGNDALTHFGETRRIIEFEELLRGRELLQHTTIICTYNEDHWQTFSEESRQAILRCHDDAF